MENTALGYRRWTFGSALHRSLLRCTPLFLGLALVLAGCGDEDGDGEGNGNKTPELGDLIRVETDTTSLMADLAVEAQEVNWFDDGSTFRVRLVGSFEDPGGGTGTVTMNLTLYAQRGEAVVPGTYTLMEAGTRRGDHAILAISSGQTAQDLVDGTLTLRAIAGDTEAEEAAEKLSRLSFSFEGNYTQRGVSEARPIEGELVFGS